ncbi:MAG: alanine racemase [Candidatus Krumholzibacteriota bacterium]|nr:alanine racemase [Candidatus Krumholzibacteriota bacterium]
MNDSGSGSKSNGKDRDLKALSEKALHLISDHPSYMDEEYLRAFVGRYTEKAGLFRDLVRDHGSPLYLLDESGLKNKLSRFREAFSILPGTPDIYYAVKSNNMPEIAGILAGEGAGLDVSSGRELDLALRAGAQKIFFSGPGKTDSELSDAVRNSGRVTLLIDSFGELDRLDRVTRGINIPIKAGVRLTTAEDGLWRKFGIPLKRLEEFFRKAEPARQIQLEGIQFHTSWNLNPDAQTAFISRLGEVLRQMPLSILGQIRFIDIGGGYWPEQGEWLRAEGTSSGALRNILSAEGTDTKSKYMLESSPIEVFAKRISETLESELPEMTGLRICMEPGRWLCHDNMHLLMKVIDLKTPDIAITDAGTNAIGWERFEHDYFPVINISDPGLEEHTFNILGSLCTPHDVWGYSFFGKSIAPGDILLIPTQGAYTYSLRQEFIKALPRTVVTSI